MLPLFTGTDSDGFTIDGSSIAYSATLLNGQPLPSFMTFLNNTLTVATIYNDFVG